MEPILFRRIICEGFNDEGLFDQAKEYDPLAWDKADVRAIIATCPVIVDDRNGPDRAMKVGPEWVASIAPPFPRFWLEFPANIQSLQQQFGIQVDVKARENGFHYTGLVFAHHKYLPKPDYIGMATGTGQNGDFTFHFPHFPDKLVSAAECIASNTLSAMIDSLVLLSCNNIELRPELHLESVQKQIAKRTHMSRFGYRYHTIVFGNHGATKRYAGQTVGEVGKRMPQHSCRGHWTRYGPKFGRGLLFGKYEGQFYIPPHVRGSAKLGIVEHGYEIPES